MDKEVQIRKEKAWKAFWALRKIFKGNMSLNAKTKIYNMCITPVLTYGAQTWALTKVQLEKIRSTQRTMERSILGIKRKDKIRNTTIREKTGMVDVACKIKKLKFKYAGHITRGENKWSKKVTECHVFEGSRRRGRPKLRWRDEITRRVGTTWNREALDRNRWRRIGEAYAQQWSG